MRQPHQPPAVGQRAGGQLQPLAADVALLRHPVRRQRHRPVAPHLAARAAGIILQQGQRDVPLRLQHPVMGQRVRAQPQVFPLPLPQTGHRAGLYLPVAVAQHLPVRAHRQPVAQGQPAALLRQQRAAVVQTVAGQAQRAALQPAGVGDGPRRQRQRPAGRQRARIVHLTGGEPAVAVRHQRAAVAQLARPEGLYLLRQSLCRPPPRVAVRRRQRDHQVAVAVYPPAVAQAVRRQPQTAGLPLAVVDRRRRRQHRRPRRQQSAGAGIGERVIGRQRQRSDTQHLPGVAHAAGRDINTPALPVALIVQRGGRQTPVPLTQKPAPGLIARRPGYRQRQRIHPQQRAAVVERLRRQVQSPPFQPPGIAQRPVRRHRQRRQPGDRAAVGQWPAANGDRRPLPAPAAVDEGRAAQAQGPLAVQAARAAVVAGQRQRALRRHLPRVAQVCPGDRQVAPCRQRAPVVQPVQRQRCPAVHRQRAGVGQRPARQLQAAGLPLAGVDHRCRRQHRRPLRQQAAGPAVGQRAVGRQRQRLHPQQRAAVVQRRGGHGQAVAAHGPAVSQCPAQSQCRLCRAGQRPLIVQPVTPQRQPVALQRAAVAQPPARNIPCPGRQQGAAVIQFVHRQLPVARQAHRPLIAPQPGPQLQPLRR